MVIKPQHHQSQLFQCLITQQIPVLMCRLKVLPPIDLHHQPGHRTVEIDHILQQRLLAIELHPCDLFASQPLPQQLFNIRHVGPEDPGIGLESLAVWVHLKSPLIPLYKGGD